MTLEYQKNDFRYLHEYDVINRELVFLKPEKQNFQLVSGYHIEHQNA